MSLLAQEQLNRGLMMSIARILLLLLNLCVALREENTADAGGPTCIYATAKQSCPLQRKTRRQEAIWGICECEFGKCRSVTVDISSCCLRRVQAKAARVSLFHLA